MNSPVNSPYVWIHENPAPWLPWIRCHRSEPFPIALSRSVSVGSCDLRAQGGASGTDPTCVPTPTAFHKPQTAVEFNGNLTGIKRALEKGLRKNRYLQWIGSWNGHWLMEGYHWSIRWNDYWGSNCPERKQHTVYESGVDLIASWLDVFSSWENPMNRWMMVIL